VIVADDSAVIREGVVRILTAGGATIAGQARTADELLALVDDLVPDLAVIDIRMPPSDTAASRRPSASARCIGGGSASSCSPNSWSRSTR